MDVRATSLHAGQRHEDPLEPTLWWTLTIQAFGARMSAPVAFEGQLRVDDRQSLDGHERTFDGR